VLIRRLPHQAACNREDGDAYEDPDQQRKVSMVEFVLAEQDDTGDFAADGDDPGDRGENAKSSGGRLLALCRAPFLGDVYLCGRLVVGLARIPNLRHC
jgi:hypothetical protein